MSDVIRVVVIELSTDDEREFAEILRSFGTENLRGCTVHVAIKESAVAVLAAMSHLNRETTP